MAAAASINTHAERRALTLASEYVVDPGDARSHLVWWMQDAPDDPRMQAATDALRAIASAYAFLIDGRNA